MYKIGILKHQNVTVLKASYTKKGRSKNETAKAVRAVSVTKSGTPSTLSSRDKLHVDSIFSPFSKAFILSMCALETQIHIFRI